MTLQQLFVIGLQTSIFMAGFSYGLRATVADVLYLVHRPSVLWRSLLAMFVVMPVVTAIAISVLELHLAVEVALMALAISPIPPLLPNREVSAGGRGSYALGLMALAGLLSIVFIPTALYILGLMVNRSIASDPGGIARTALMSVVAPLASGMLCRRVSGGLAARIERPVRLVATALLGVGVLAILASTGPAMWTLIGNGTILAIVVFVVCGLLVGHALGGPDPGDRIVLALSTACRHPAIALGVATAAFPRERLIVGAILLYLLLNVIVSVPYVRWQRQSATNQRGTARA